MKVVLSRRAEVAIRSLEKAEQRQVAASLDRLKATEPAAIGRLSRLARLRAASGERLYSYAVNQDLRLLLTIHGETCMVEDLASHDRLDRLALLQGR